MNTGRANLLDRPNGHFFVANYPVPKPGAGQLLLKIEMCGICGTDAHTWHAPAEAVFGLEYPISLGHEISGIIADLGKGVETDSIGGKVNVGDRVGVIPAIHCGQCYFCRIAKTPEKCTSWKTYGTWPCADQEPHFTGGYGDYLFLHHPNSFFIKSTTTAERTVFLEPMAVVVHALLHAKIQPGDTVVVQGSGPIGLLTTAAAKISGAARVISTGRRNRARVELAKAMGADMVILSSDMPDPEARKRFVHDNSLNHVGADVVINTVGTCAAFQECFGFVRDSGTIVEAGNFVDSGTFPFNPCKNLLERGITLIGSFDNAAEHFVRAMPLISDPRIPLEKLISHKVAVADVEKFLSAIEHSEKVDGREIVKAVMDSSL